MRLERASNSAEVWDVARKITIDRSGELHAVSLNASKSIARAVMILSLHSCKGMVEELVKTEKKNTNLSQIEGHAKMRDQSLRLSLH